MAQSKSMLLAFNRGIISSLGLGRVDLKRMGYAAETQTNIMPRVLGSAMLRPGWKYIATVEGDDEKAILAPFIFSVDDTTVIEFTGRASPDIGTIRVFIDDAPIEGSAITAAVTNAFFISNLNGWTDSDESGAVSSWQADTAFNGFMNLKGDGLNAAIREQQVTVNETGVEHMLTVNVDRGPVTFRVGSTAGAEDYIAETALDTGTHRLVFTPSGDFHIHISNRLKYTVKCTGCSLVTSATPITFGTEYGESDLPNLRFAQSGDVIFIACAGHQQRKIERRGTRSWALTDYESVAGPFRAINVTDITMTPSGLTGDITVTASKSFFRSGHVGGQIRISSNGQTVSSNISAEDNFTDPIRVIGIDDARIFNVDISGTFTATVTVQYSVGEPGAWVDLSTTYSGATSTTIDDGLDNQIIYYRIGVKTGDYSSGTVVAQLSIASGSITGIARIVEYTSATIVNAVVLRAFGDTGPSKDWWESDWSGYRGWPTAVDFHEGRLWWAGLDKIWGSISDSYYDFDDEFVGDAGPIARNIGFGPIQNIHWLMGLGRLIMGTAQNSANVAPDIIDGNNVVAARSTSFDEPLTPTNFNLKNVSPVGLFVDRSKARLYQLAFNGDDYIPDDLSIMVPDLNSVGITYIAVQMKPDVRIHCVRADGKVSALVFDRAENVAAWVEIETDGLIEHAAVLPGTVEDQVYYVVKRTIDGSDYRYVEKWALESECQGGTLNKQADSFFEYSGASTSSITGLDHLEGESVVAWGSGKNLGTYTVSGGSITLSEAVTSCIVGLTYRGRFKGAKLASMFEGGLSLKRKIDQLALLMLNTHHQGIKYGPSFSELYDLPAVIDDTPVATDHVFPEFDFDLFAYGGNWKSDSRLHLEANAPLPVTLQAVSMVVSD